MKTRTKSLLLACLLLSAGCQRSTDDAKVATGTLAEEQTVNLVSQVVEASCGECQFDMEGDGCDLAVRIDGKGYYVDGAKMGDYGDAHGNDGMCGIIRKAKVTGEIKDGRFAATAFELLSRDDESEAPSP